MGERLIKPTSRVRSLLVADCLSSLFALELLTPAPEYYLFSAFISDFEVLTNSFGQFRTLLPGTVGRSVRLSGVLTALYERGAQVYVLTREDGGNRNFLERLPDIPVKSAPRVHDKLFVCEHFFLRGSMNFTYTGTHASDETTEISTEEDKIHRALIEARDLWNAIP